MRKGLHAEFHVSLLSENYKMLTIVAYVKNMAPEAFFSEKYIPFALFLCYNVFVENLYYLIYRGIKKCLKPKSYAHLDLRPILPK